MNAETSKWRLVKKGKAYRYDKGIFRATIYPEEGNRIVFRNHQLNLWLKSGLIFESLENAKLVAESFIEVWLEHDEDPRPTVRIHPVDLEKNYERKY